LYVLGFIHIVHTSIQLTFSIGASPARASMRLFLALGVRHPSWPQRCLIGVVDFPEHRPPWLGSEFSLFGDKLRCWDLFVCFFSPVLQSLDVPPRSREEEKKEDAVAGVDMLVAEWSLFLFFVLSNECFKNTTDM